MKIAQIEISAVREVAVELKDQVVELSELDLVLVGGGTGDVQFG